jgi:hypothetical protein
MIITAVCALLLGMVTVPALAQTSEGAGIDSPVMIPHKAISYDANGDGVSQPEELIGEYDVYNATLPLNFHWASVTGATYYRVSLIQYTLPGKAAPSPSREVKLSHHSAADPNGPKFSMAVGDSSVCVDCVSYIQITPETMTLADDGITRIYMPLGSGTQTLGPFVLEYLPGSRSGSGAGGFGPPCGNNVCNAGEDDETGIKWCPFDCDN